VIFLYAVYYAVLISWMLFYFINSFFSPLPWNSCDNDWNIKETCVISQSDKILPISTSNVSSWANATLYNNASYVGGAVSTVSTVNATVSAVNTTTISFAKETAAEQFWL